MRDVVVSRILSDIDEVQKRPKGEHESGRNAAHKTAKQDSCHVLPLAARDLGQGRDPVFEVTGTERRRKAANSSIQL